MELTSDFVEFFFRHLFCDLHHLTALIGSAFTTYAVGDGVCSTVGAEGHAWKCDLVVLGTARAFLGATFLSFWDSHGVLLICPRGGERP